MASLNKQALRRYYIIDRLIRSRRYPSMDDFIDRCEEEIGTKFSKETIQKDIQTMKYDRLLNFNAPIYYNRSYMGYEYLDENFKIEKVNLSDDEYDAIENVKGIVNQLEGTKLNKEFNGAMTKVSVHIKDLETPVINFHNTNYNSDSWGIDYFMDLIINRIPVKVYRTINDEISEAILHPYMLKESFMRWMLVAYNEENKIVDIYDISNIKHIEKLDNHRFIKVDFDVSRISGKTILSDIDSRHDFTVVLKFKEDYYNMITTFPVSKDQEITKFYKNGDFLIRFKTGLSVELFEWILSLGTNAKVVKPDWLSYHIRFTIEEMLEKYD